MMKRNRNNPLSPLVMVLCVIIGMLVALLIESQWLGNRLSIINTSGYKLNDLLRIIDDQYVDTVDMKGLIEDAMPQILSELDPHSVYINAEDSEVDDNLKSSFSGVGIEFVISKDTIRVQGVISGGPSERAGILPGDKIVSVDDTAYVGPNISSEGAVKKLKGPKGSKVKIGILRRSIQDAGLRTSNSEEESDKIKYFTVTRDDIPQRSISATYMLDDVTGYMKIKNFAENTYPDMLIALAQLTQKGAENLVIDLRGNTGGYLAAAVQVANEFLSKGRMIVYTQGRKSPRQDYRSDGRGSCKHQPLIILVDETSASASEILAGAIQDNDRGTIIGRRSFGKGLVQQPIPMSDGSVVRLTVARYYTPSGRCIQKPYTSGTDKSYEQDLINRFQHGEYYSKDSIKQTGEVFLTALGREVYGGGGIMPDIFIPEDTTGITSYYTEASMSGLIIQYAYQYVDNNRNSLSKYKSMVELARYLSRQGLVKQFVVWAEGQGLKRRNILIKKSYKLIERFLISRVIYAMLGDTAWTEYLNLDDPVIMKCKEVFNAGQAFPKGPEDKEEIGVEVQGIY